MSDQVYLFGTCLIDAFYPEAGMDALALLELCGLEVIFPQEQTCCGQAPYNSGELSPGIATARHTLNTFPDNSIPLIVPSASCAGMIKHHYPSLFPKHSPEHKKALDLSNRTYELIEFLLSKLPYTKQKELTPITVSLHRSCSAQREMNVAGYWLDILNKLDNVQIKLPAYESECCGFGGTFSVKSPAISTAMTEDKSKHLLSENPDILVSGDCGCLMNLSHYMKRQHIEIPSIHIARFIAQRFGINHD